MSMVLVLNLDCKEGKEGTKRDFSSAFGVHLEKHEFGADFYS